MQTGIDKGIGFLGHPSGHLKEVFPNDLRLPDLTV